MKVNICSQNTTFGMQNIQRFNLSPRVDKLVDAVEQDIMCMGLPSTKCEIHEVGPLGKILVVVSNALDWNFPVNGTPLGRPIVPSGVIDIVDKASHESSQKFMDKFNFGH